MGTQVFSKPVSVLGLLQRFPFLLGFYLASLLLVLLWPSQTGREFIPNPVRAPVRLNPCHTSTPVFDTREEPSFCFCFCYVSTSVIPDHTKPGQIGMYRHMRMRAYADGEPARTVCPSLLFVTDVQD